ncbi:hypothetical protein ITJ64_09480 [Herbiconiux sp. VKM Ac-1786]|uniref:hypothetical protein n=1 Tax=Herbiconiux sp. VKM Ac-1786 TaxID=2783824 RepID=UPI00188B6F98|nr:hypothetical protein [Herbiconiux sp. VKM Ac-1786]MBF4572750.1 hypothetical protein [Herbiconiux sp. VKM Ac-1786]
MTFELSRRTVVGMAAWSVPVIASAVAAPALAASGDTVAFAPSVVFAPSGAQEFTVAGTAPGASRVALVYPAGFGGPSEVDVTDGAFALPLRCPVGSASGVVTATAAGLGAGSLVVTVQPGGQDTGSITWTNDSVTGTSRTLPALTGSISTRGSFLPDVQLSYPAGFTGPATAVVSWTSGSGTAASIGTFSVRGVTVDAGATSGTIVVSPADFQGQVVYTPAAATLAVTQV